MTEYAVIVPVVQCMRLTDALGRQDLSCMYLARHELQDVAVIINVVEA